MDHRDPSSYSWITYAWVITLSAWGGIVSFLAKVRDGKSHAFSLIEFVGEITTSAFSGLLTFYGCEAVDIDPLYTVVLVGISGHMGTRAIYQFELYMQRRLGLKEDKMIENDYTRSKLGNRDQDRVNDND